MRWGASWSYVAVTWTWLMPHDQRITDNNAEIQKSTTEYSFRKEIGRNKKETKGQIHKLLSVSAPNSPALKWFASDIDMGGGLFWRIRGVGKFSKDLLLCTLFVPSVNGPLARSNHKTQQPSGFYQAKFKLLNSIDSCLVFCFVFCLPVQFHLQLWTYESCSCSTSDTGTSTCI